VLYSHLLMRRTSDEHIDVYQPGRGGGRPANRPARSGERTNLLCKRSSQLLTVA
jgi:hypothetical protein